MSPGLSDAINSISRWSFIKASLPHIMHACASALIYRHERLSAANYTTSTTAKGATTTTTTTAATAAAAAAQKLGKTETKLLYTLHWLILDAGVECEDNAAASGRSGGGGGGSGGGKKQQGEGSGDEAMYLHSVATIQLFVYLFVPILNTLTPSDLDNLKIGQWFADLGTSLVSSYATG